MTRDETKQLIEIMQATYPISMPKTPAELSRMVDVWHAQLKEDEYKTFETALVVYNRQNVSGFPPSIGQLVSVISAIKDPEMTAVEAWGFVSKAIRNGAYNSSSEWEKLPERVRACVTPHQIHMWSISENFNEDVAMSNFRRSFEVRQKQTREMMMLPPIMRDMLSSLGDKMLLEG